MENADQGYTVAFIGEDLFSKLKYYGYSQVSDRDQWADQEIEEIDGFEDLLRI